MILVMLGFIGFMLLIIVGTLAQIKKSLIDQAVDEVRLSNDLLSELRQIKVLIIDEDAFK